jgi:RecJ-like exonuclease
MHKEYCSACHGLDDESADCDRCSGTGYEPTEIECIRCGDDEVALDEAGVCKACKQDEEDRYQADRDYMDEVFSIRK